MTDPTDITGRRIGAWVIDLIIYFIFMFALASTIGGAKITQLRDVSKVSADSYCEGIKARSGDPCFVAGSGDNYTAIDIADAGRSATFWSLHLIGYILIQGLAGGSLGKLAVGLRVVDEQGKQAGIGKSTIRTFLWVGDAITCAVPIVGGVLILSTKGHRRLGDMAAGTYVVPKDQMGRPPLSVVGAPGDFAGAATAAGWGTPTPQGGGSQWTPPGSPTSGPTWSPPSDAPAPTPAASSPAAGEGPTWDTGRNAYIQYDRQQNAWVQWSDANQSWGPIDQ